ncbi:MAG: deoxyribonuclease IV, partial [Dehalococcoidia bacterium]|nr:deoxyribonuclease IV [Dehalococcoidia bacterium]
MRVGLHLSIGKGLRKTAQTAAYAGCQAIQIFSGNPMGWKPSRHDPKEVEAFRSVLLEKDISPLYLHTPYLVNLAAPNPDVYAKSVATLAAALDLAGLLGASYVVTHLGSHVGTGLDAGKDRVVQALAEALRTPSGAMVLLENSPGSRNELGSYFEEIGGLLGGLETIKGRLGVCLDTAHLWGAGYDLSTQEGVNQTLDEFERLVGIDRLHCIHANDSSVARGSRWDLHVIPGEGQIGVEGFRSLVNHPRLAEMTYILELPRVDDEECAPAVQAFKGLAALLPAP